VDFCHIVEAFRHKTF